MVLITPFNFPLEIPALQLMGALYMGNKPLLHVDQRVREGRGKEAGCGSGPAPLALRPKPAAPHAALCAPPSRPALMHH